ncbi:hypothetical protein BaRGS_00028638 [Batillaria attramentaria]|uniref:G-protein coupled receptors family 1 profile domain-containing protein n=1 Tax=Batillaria attramentaria TaxID=370345 RepID=A0ABD0JYT6_9CAEN
MDQFVSICVNHYTSGPGFSPFLSIPYAVIFLLSVVGNSLVILTLVRHKKMRTITNMFLLNLAFLYKTPVVMCRMDISRPVLGVHVSCFQLIAADQKAVRRFKRYIATASGHFGQTLSCTLLEIASSTRFTALRLDTHVLLQPGQADHKDKICIARSPSGKALPNLPEHVL